jgi:hypothetical protein
LNENAEKPKQPFAAKISQVEANLSNFALSNYPIGWTYPANKNSFKINKLEYIKMEKPNNFSNDIL